jgi:hypothetical protein
MGSPASWHAGLPVTDIGNAIEVVRQMKILGFPNLTSLVEKVRHRRCWRTRRRHCRWERD